MKPSLACLLLAAVSAAVFPSRSAADVRLPNLISSNMVLQCDMPDPIWGWADPGEKVTVAFNGKTADATADKDGKWKLKIGPFAPGGPFEMQVQGKNTITLKNILVGEVWVCAGQSNMTLTMGETANSKAPNAAAENKKLIAAADFPQIRYIGIPPDVASKPIEDVPGIRWTECSPKTVSGYSAVAYLFGRDLHKGLNVPVGLIQTGVNDTRAEYYMSRETLKGNPDFQFVFDRWNRWKKDTKVDVDYPNIDDDFGKTYHELDDKAHKYYREAQAAEKTGQPAPPKPDFIHAWSDKDGPGQWHMVKNFPTGQYYANICPLIPLGIRGVVWYQGEANIGSPDVYPKLMSALIKSWRSAWAQGDFPFLIVQLPRAEAKTKSYADLRYAQLEIFRAVPNTGLAVTSDILFELNQDFVHPPQKEPVGHRLALIALAGVYHKDVPCSGPLYKSAAREGNAIRVKFDYATGLAAGGGGDLTDFTIAGLDKKFVPAKAVIDKDTVLVSSPDVPEPLYVRYAWQNEPTGNLTNASGLPASVFRTDDGIKPEIARPPAALEANPNPNPVPTLK